MELLSLFRAVPPQCPALFEWSALALPHHPAPAAGFWFSSSPLPWSQHGVFFFSRAKNAKIILIIKKGLAEISVGCARVGGREGKKLEKRRFFRKETRDWPVLGWGGGWEGRGGEGGGRTFMARSSNPVRKCGLRWHHRGWRGRQGCFPPRHKMHACRNFFFLFWTKKGNGIVSLQTLRFLLWLRQECQKKSGTISPVVALVWIMLLFVFNGIWRERLWIYLMFYLET